MYYYSMNAQYGPDTEELLKRIDEIEDDRLILSELHITSLPPLPSTLKYLYFYNTVLRKISYLPPNLLCLYCNLSSIEELPSLPESLRELYISYTQIRNIPELPKNLISLHCEKTPITSLPTLPESLENLNCAKTSLTSLPPLPPRLEKLNILLTHIQELPPLPEKLRSLKILRTPLILNRKNDETIADYNERWKVWREEKESKKRCEGRTKLLKEELVATVWHPRRVEKMLEVEGFDALCIY